MSEIGRREMLAGMAAAMLAGRLDAQSAQQVHQAVQSTGAYQPKALTSHEFATLKTLCETIVPGASKGGAAEFIDLLSSQNPEMLAIYTGGLLWIDEKLKRDSGADFLSSKPEDRAALLDRIAFRRNDSPELAPGIRFFAFARRMTVDAYYTSPAGIAEVGYLGNKGETEFHVPQDLIDAAVRRSLLE